jgi:hypothetical protein
LQRQLRTRLFWRGGHDRWDVENDCFNTLSTHLALDHCFRHEPTAIVNFILTCFIAYVLLQCFWRGNVKPQLQKIIGTFIGLIDELYRGLGPGRARLGWPNHLDPSLVRRIDTLCLTAGHASGGNPRFCPEKPPHIGRLNLLRRVIAACY